MVHTSVGIRCRECLRLRVLPTYSVAPEHYLKAAAFGIAVAAAVGVVWGLLPALGFWMALVMGIGVGESVSWAANMKRGPGLQAIAGFSVLMGVAISRVPSLLAVVDRSQGASGIRGLDLPFLSTLGLDLLSLVFVALAFALALIRLR